MYSRNYVMIKELLIVSEEIILFKSKKREKEKNKEKEKLKNQ